MTIPRFWEEEIPSGLIIPLRPLTTQLIFTMISAISELFLVSCVIVLIVFAESRALLRGNAVSIKRHLHRIRAAQLLAILLFVVLETLLSTYQKSVPRPIRETQPCFKVGPATELPRSLNFEEQFNLSIVTDACEGVQPGKTGNLDVSIFGGRLSLKPGREGLLVNCDKDWIYNYSSNAGPLLTTPLEVEPFCLDYYPICSYATSTENVVSFGIFVKTNDSERQERKAVLNFSPDFSPMAIAERRLELLEEDVPDSVVLQLLFLSVKKAECDMIVGVSEQSLLPYWLVYLAGSMWTSSVFLLVLSLMLKRVVFYNISNAKDWAKKVDWSKNEHIQGNYTHMRSMMVDGVSRVHLCGADPTNRRNTLPHAVADDTI